MKKVIFKVNDMNSYSSKIAVEEAAGALIGVLSASASVDKKTVTVYCGDWVKADALKNTIRLQGYQAHEQGSITRWDFP